MYTDCFSSLKDYGIAAAITREDTVATLLDQIRPKHRRRLMDLVEQAGFDISDWANYAKGDTAPAANPRYCYEWSLINPGRAVVLNLWLDNMREEDGRIIHEANYRADAEEHQRNRSKPQWVARGFALDRALQAALTENLPVRVIVTDGQRRELETVEATASIVQVRNLDSETWTIASYDWITGNCRLVRSRHAAGIPAN
jgi:hypothetical protein